MRPLLALFALSLLACGGGNATTETKAPDTVKSAKPPAISEIKKRDDSQKVDKIGGADGQLTPDGKMDVAFDVTLRGPIIGLLMHSVNESAWQWDTYVGTETIPVAMKALAPKGGMTGSVVVFENDKVLNAPDGSFKIQDDAEHHVVVYISDNGAFQPGAKFRLAAETADHQIIESPDVTY